VGLNRPIYDYNRAITLEEYRTLELSRPITDPPLGGMTSAKRSAGETASAAVSETLGYVPDKQSVLETLARLAEDRSKIYANCGTPNGVRRHLANKTPMCDACIEAPIRKRPPGKTRPRRNPGEPKDAA
jgi:hypothetical protein